MPLKFWERPTGSTHTAYNLFGMIAGTQTPLPHIEAYEHAVSMLGNDVNVSYQADGGSRPRIVQARSQEAVIIGISGAQTGYMFAGLVGGYQQPAESIRNTGVNSFAAEAAMQLAVTYDPILPTVRYCLIGGYSYGCVVAWGLYNYIRRNHPTCDVRLTTYGSPKPGQRELENAYSLNRPENVWQYACDNDPVPYVMPNLEQAPNFYRTVNVASARNMNEYRHVLQFVQLTVEGTAAQMVDYPTRTNSNAEVAIISWMAGREGWNTSGHHWTSYKQRLYLLSRRFPDIESEGSPALIAQLPATPSPDPVTTQYTPISPPLYSRGDTPRPLPESPIPAGRGRRRGTPYTVVWNGIPIATFTQGSKARRLRNTLRRLATSMRQADSFEYEQVDDALLYNRALEQNGQVTEIR